MRAAILELGRRELAEFVALANCHDGIDLPHHACRSRVFDSRRNPSGYGTCGSNQGARAPGLAWPQQERFDRENGSGTPRGRRHAAGRQAWVPAPPAQSTSIKKLWNQWFA
jgi:hypothetical protein